MKKIFTIVLLGACVMIMAACSSGTATTADENTPDSTVATEVDPAVTTNNNGKAIGEEKAKAIALKHAGLKESEVTFALAHLDYDDGIEAYDVEFYQEGKEYDYEIEAYTGEIISYDHDMESRVAAPNQSQQAQQPQQPQQVPSQNNGGSNKAKISLEDAKKIALKKAGLSASNVTFTETSFEYDDGFEVYQIGFVSGDMEYEMDIDANSGNIMEYDVESIYD